MRHCSVKCGFVVPSEVLSPAGSEVGSWRVIVVEYKDYARIPVIGVMFGAWSFENNIGIGL